jgi:hypothetical protein
MDGGKRVDPLMTVRSLCHNLFMPRNLVAKADREAKAEALKFFAANLQK